MTRDGARSMRRAAAISIRTASNHKLGLGVVALVDITLAAAILLGSDARVAGVSFQSAKMLAPLEVWAVLILAFGVLVLAAMALQTRLTPIHGRIAIGVPCALAAGWHAWWATAFAVTAAQRDDAALTGVPAYTGYALLHLLVALREEG